MNARPGGVFVYIIYFVDEKSFSNPFIKSSARLNLIGIYTDDFSTSPGNVTILIHVYDFIDPPDIRLKRNLCIIHTIYTCYRVTRRVSMRIHILTCMSSEKCT